MVTVTSDMASSVVRDAVTSGKALQPLTEEQIKDRHRMKTGILSSNYKYLVAFDPENVLAPWSVLSRDDLKCDPPGIRADIRMDPKNRKHPVLLEYKNKKVPVMRYVFARCENGKCPIKYSYELLRQSRRFL